MDPNFLELLQCLNDSKVRYLVIGGYAVIRFTEPRYTKDLDILIEASTANAKRVLKALTEFGAPVDNLSVADLAKPGLIYVFGLPPVRIDIINRASGAVFGKAWKSKEKVPLGSTYAYFVGKAELIKMKRAAGRPQDIADLEKLRGAIGAKNKNNKSKKKTR